MFKKLKCWLFGHEVHVGFNEDIYKVIPSGHVIRQCVNCGELLKVEYEQVSEYMYNYTIKEYR